MVEKKGESTSGSSEVAIINLNDEIPNGLSHEKVGVIEISELLFEGCNKLMLFIENELAE